MYTNRIVTYYRDEMVLAKDSEENFSKSPMKPKLMMEYLKAENLHDHFEIINEWEGFTDKEFLRAHTEKYVNAFFAGEKECELVGMEWSEQFADSVRFTNASLYNSIRHSILNRTSICFSPTSGFHHARPSGGSSYCTFSGQVIVSLKIYEDFGLSGCYVDLDGHYGNSIEDSRKFCPQLAQASPKGFNINPAGARQMYLDDLKLELKKLEEAILAEEIGYVVFCHGADSHKDDELGYQLTTEEWLECSRMVYGMIKQVSEKRGKTVPLSLCMFGGYRSDDYNSVLSLHTADMMIGLNILAGESIEYEPKLKERKIETNFPGLEQGIAAYTRRKDTEQY